MLPRGRLAGVVAVAVAALFAACGCSVGEDGETPERSERKASAPRPPPRPLVSLACVRNLDRRDRAANGLADRAAREHDAVRGLRRRVRGALVELEAARGQLEAGEAYVRRAESRVEGTVAALQAFQDAHPERALPPPLYEEWERLRSEYEAARRDYERAFGRYQAVLREYRRAESAYEEAVRTLEAAADRLERLVHRHGVTSLRYDARLERCLERAGDFPAGERERITGVEGRVAKVVSALSGRQAEVHCEASPSWPRIRGPRILGYVPRGSAEVYLAPSVCFTLHGVLVLGRRPDLSCLRHSEARGLPLCGPAAALLVRAVTTLAHEAQHVAGVEEEPRAECGGLPGSVRTAEALGVAPGRARLLAWYAWRFPHTPPAYRSRACPRPSK